MRPQVGEHCVKDTKEEEAVKIGNKLNGIKSSSTYIVDVDVINGKCVTV